MNFALLKLVFHFSSNYLALPSKNFEFSTKVLSLVSLILFLIFKINCVYTINLCVYYETKRYSRMVLN